MAVISHTKREINLKIVYCGPGLSGKTTNLRWLNGHLDDARVGKLVSLATQTDRTLFFDLMPVTLGKIKGFNVRIQLLTTPGQVFYNATRKLVLKGVDGIVFVADSQPPMEEANLESLQNLRENLTDYNRELDTVPLVFQYNKRDLDQIMPIKFLQKNLNPRGLPYFEASAITGKGIQETFEKIAELTFQNLQNLPLGERPKLDSEPTRKVSIFSRPLAAASQPNLEIPEPLLPSPSFSMGKELRVKSCLEPTVLDNGTIKIPLILEEPISGHEFEMTLELSLKKSRETGNAAVIVHSKKK